MNDRERELIELVQSQLPQDLTEEQLAELRQAMRSSEPLREAILDELRLEQGLATRLAPEGMDSEDFVDHISRLAGARRRARFIWFNTIALLLVLIIGGGLLLMSSVQVETTEVAANDAETDEQIEPQNNGEDPAEGDADNPDAADNAKLAGGDAAVPDRPDQPGDQARPAPPKVDPEPIDFAPNWALFDDPAANGDRRWIANISRVLRPDGGNMDVDENRGEFRIRGAFELTPPNADGRVIRLRFHDHRRFRVNLWNGSRGAQFEMDKDRQFRAYTVERPKPAEDPFADLPGDIDQRFRTNERFDKVDERITLSPWPDKLPRENIAVRWTGKLLTPRDGKYKLIATTDDGVRLYINGKRVVDDWRDRGPEASVAELDLKKGSHDIVVEYFQGGGGAEMKLEWEGPKINRQLIPADALRVSGDRNAAKGLRGLYCFGGAYQKATLVKRLLVDQDDFEWRRFREGAIDLRYERGLAILARGDDVLLAVPMSRPPRTAELDAECRLRYADLLKLKPLEPLAMGGPKPDESLRAADVDWKPFPEHHTEWYTVEKNDAGLTITRKKDQHDIRLLRELKWEPGLEVAVHVTDATTWTGVGFEHPQSDNHFYQYVVGEFKGERVLCQDPGNHGHRQALYERGVVIGNDFWVKASYGIGHVMIAYSNDGVNWMRLDRHDFDSKRPLRDTVRVGPYCFYKDGDRRVRVSRVNVRRANPLLALAEGAPVAKVPAFPDPEKRDDPNLWTRVMRELPGKRPKDVDERAWSRACDAWTVTSGAPPRYARKAAFDLVRGAVGKVEPEALRAALDDLPRLVAISHEDKYAHSVEGLMQLYDRVASGAWTLGRRDELALLLEQWYDTDLGWAGRWYHWKSVAPATLVRLHFYDLLNRGAWEQLRLSTLKFDFLTRRGYGRHERHDDSYPVIMLATWMETRAARALDADPRLVGNDDIKRRWARHPLVVDSDRESLNIVAEFLASVDAEAYDHACRIMTQRALPDGIAPVDHTERLFKATYVLLRHLLDTKPELADMLRTKYQGIGMVRLRQALANGQIDQLEAIATQFHGTPAAREAMIHLADRDLSMGNFFSAASRYETLMTDAGGPEKQTLAAKRRLALAMTGVEAGQPVKHTVKFRNQKLSAGQFESLVQSLLKERRKSTGMMGVGAAEQRPAPGPGKFRVQRIEELRGPRDLHSELRNETGAGPMSWTVHDNLLLLHQFARLHCVDLNNGKTRWRKEDSARDMSRDKHQPGRPVVFNNRVYVPFRRNRQTEIACYDLGNGKDIWRQRYDDEIAGDPVIIGPWLYVLTVREELGDYADLVLRRIAPDTGESVLAKRIVRMRYSEAMYRVGRPVLANDALIYRAGNALICCDTLGETRWIRRLPFIPAQVDEELSEKQRLSELIVHDGKLIVAAPGSPNIQCIDVETGSEVWSYLQPQLRRVIGVVGGRLIVAGDGVVQGFDPATGEPVWHEATTAHPDAIIGTKDDRLALITMEKVDRPDDEDLPDERRIVWRDAKDGGFVATTPLPEEHRDTYKARMVTTDGKRFVLTTNYARHRDARLVLLQPK